MTRESIDKRIAEIEAAVERALGNVPEEFKNWVGGLSDREVEACEVLMHWLAGQPPSQPATQTAAVVKQKASPTPAARKQARAEARAAVKKRSKIMRRAALLEHREQPGHPGRAVVIAAQLRRLQDLERRVARLPQPGRIPPALAMWLQTLTNGELDVVERFAEMLGSHRLDVRPAERMSDQEATAEWFRLTRHPGQQQ